MPKMSQKRKKELSLLVLHTQEELLVMREITTSIQGPLIYIGVLSQVEPTRHFGSIPGTLKERTTM